MRRTYVPAWRRRQEAAEAAQRRVVVENLFGFELQDGSIDYSEAAAGTPYHAACAPATARPGYGWAVEDLRPCAACGGALGQPPVVATVAPQTRLVASPARYADGTPYWWTREEVQ